jgi:hypothetical protein
MTLRRALPGGRLARVSRQRSRVTRPRAAQILAIYDNLAPRPAARRYANAFAVRVGVDKGFAGRRGRVRTVRHRTRVAARNGDNMRWTKILGLCLAAAFVAGATASALAENPMPELNWGECVRNTAGDYGTACKSEGGKSKGFEDQTITKNYPKKSSSGVVRIRVPAFKAVVECTGSKDTGEAAPPNKEVKIVIKFIGCKLEGKPCNAEGAKKEELVTKPLAGELGWINKSKEEVGFDLKPETGTALLEADCQGFHIKLEGSVIGRIAPVNVFTKKFTITFAPNASEKQEPESFEGGANDTLQTTIVGVGTFPTTLETVVTQTFKASLYIETDNQP